MSRKGNGSSTLELSHHVLTNDLQLLPLSITLSTQIQTRYVALSKEQLICLIYLFFYTVQSCRQGYGVGAFTASCNSQLKREQLLFSLSVSRLVDRGRDEWLCMN